MLARLISIRTLAVALAALLGSTAVAVAQEEEEESTVEEEGGSGLDPVKIDPNQPAVTSGGRYSIVTFPLSELDRTLLLVDGVLELRADIDILMTKKQTFDVWTLNAAGRYGIGDTLEIQAGGSFQLVVPSGGKRAITPFAAVEGSIMYDLLDWRAGVAIPTQPDVTVDIFFGLPLKVRVLKDRIAILALEKILTIHTRSFDKDGTGPGGDELQKPDLTISVGALVQVLKQLAIILRGEIQSVGFEGDIVVPVQLDLQYTINNQMDVGATLRLYNLNKSQGMSVENCTTIDCLGRFDQRSIAFFFRFRI